ncbi:MAG: glucuronate isomerase [Paracoccaceae bacterium]
MLNPDRLFPSDPTERAIARRLYEGVRDLPLICPHGHTDPAWFATNAAFENPTELLILPDHYVRRMLVSQGFQVLDMVDADGKPENRAIWQVFAENYHLFQGTPTRLWLDQTFNDLFGLTERLSKNTADMYYERISDCLSQDAFRPRAIAERFNIEVITTTEGPCDPLDHHRAIAQSGWGVRVITSYRPDAVIDPDGQDFVANLKAFAACTGEDTTTWAGYLAAHRNRRAYFRDLGATSTDHGHPTAQTLDLTDEAAAALFDTVRHGTGTLAENEMFRAQMLTEMAKMSLEDGMVMQMHVGSHRNHNTDVLARFGTDQGFDIPRTTDFVTALKPLLDRLGMDPRLSIILFTLDETTYGRELAPLAGAYPSLKLGPAWWFFDSPAGMMRYREFVTETAGFYNTVGFNDDTRALPSIAARHDVARRVDCAFLAGQVALHLLDEDEAAQIASDLTYGLAKKAYNL